MSPRFRVALSYPGEYRPFVSKVADHLGVALGRERVLYDRDHEAEFARPDLDTYLQALYHDQSELNVVFLCAEYQKKEWCGLEWRAIRDLIKKRQGSAVMLLRFDSTEIPGLLSIDGYLPIGDRPPEKVAAKILERLAGTPSPAGEEAGGDTGGDNAFNPYNPALPPRFVGREAELRSLEASLLEGHGISIVGDSRIGKTSLLRTWEQKALALARTVVFLDGQEGEGSSIEAFVGKILGQPAPEKTDPAADALAAWAEAQPASLPPVLLIDELDAIVPRFDPRFFDRLRAMLGRVVVAVASRRPVDLLYKELGWTSPFANRLEIVQLGLLKAEAAEEIIGSSPELDGEAREWMRQWAGQHPFHLQLLGRYLLRAQRAGENRREALERYLDEANSRLRELWDRLSPREQKALRGAAQGSATELRSLRRRGLIGDDGLPFGKVLAAWFEEGH